MSVSIAPLSLPSALVPTGRATRLLRAQIEAATGLRFSHPRSGARLVAWVPAGSSGQRGTRALPVVSVMPGPILSPYDSPSSGMTSLRIRYAGRSWGGATVAPTFLAAMKRHRLAGTNRFLPGVRPEIGRVASGRSTATLLYVEAAAAFSARRLRRLVLRARALQGDGRIVVAGPEGCRLASTDALDIDILNAPADPWALFEGVGRVLAPGPEAEGLARLAGLDVVRLDRGSGVEVDVEGEAFGAGVHYFDPWTRAPIAVDEALDKAAWLRDRFVSNRRRIVLVGISRWKRPAIDVFADGPLGRPIHAMTAQDAVAAARETGAEVQAWATRSPATLPALCAAADIPFSRIEDGFLRSVGLGASLKLGASIVVDDRGIYFDPRVDSRLTEILRDTAFSEPLVARARALRRAIVGQRLSKYNVGMPAASDDWPADRSIVLVPGQVEDDASVRYGSPRVRTNLELLRAARARNPRAFLVYKPHPDVEAGFRPGAVPDAIALGLADRIVGGIAIVDLLDRVQHVETMTSLAGFEALLRGRTVATHGRPFYAGWGLTEDLAPDASRGRRLSLDELVAGTLILYPRYIDPVAMKLCEPEHLLDRLSEARAARGPSRLSIGSFEHWFMRARYAVLNPLVRRLRERRGVGSTGDGSR